MAGTVIIISTSTTRKIPTTETKVVVVCHVTTVQDDQLIQNTCKTEMKTILLQITTLFKLTSNAHSSIWDNQEISQLQPCLNSQSLWRRIIFTSTILVHLLRKSSSFLHRSRGLLGISTRQFLCDILNFKIFQFFLLFLILFYTLIWFCFVQYY